MNGIGRCGLKEDFGLVFLLCETLLFFNTSVYEIAPWGLEEEFGPVLYALSFPISSLRYSSHRTLLCFNSSVCMPLMERDVGVGPNGGSEVGLGVGIGGIISEAQRPPVQLDLLPSAPPLRALQSQLTLSTCLTEYGNGNRKCCNGELIDDGDDAHALVSSPNSTVSSFQMGVDFSVASSMKSSTGRGRIRDEDEAANARKKLRLSKDQSAYLDKSFKEHTTPNPKQKLALARQLNLRPRQVEVWFQNRRARTKLKQTEVECEYLNRCCKTLTEENRRMQKEIEELRALKVTHPFYTKLPPTTLTLCPSCERVAKTTNANQNPLKSFPSAIAQPHLGFYPFPHFPSSR